MRFHEFTLFKIYVHMYVHKRPTKYYPGSQIKETEKGGTLVRIGDTGGA
jgi:hypothetical protein